MHYVISPFGASSSILMLGRDQILLDTRCWILEQAGYRVQTSLSWARARTCMPAGLFIVCYTVPLREQLSILEEIVRSWPQVKSLCLTSSKIDIERAATTFDPCDGPQKFIETVGKLLVN